MIRKAIFVFALILSSCSSSNSLINEGAKEKGNKQVLWFEQPAESWMQALPVGNGRLGAMVYGDPHNERIQLNEDSMWPGGPDWENSKGTVEDLKKIRKLIKDGDLKEADREIVERFSYKDVVKSHQTLGDLFINFQNRGVVENYKRSLNLENAGVDISYTSNGEEYTQKVFASAPDDVIIVELTSTSREGIELILKMDRPLDKGHSTVKVSNPSGNEISMTGEVTQYGAVKNSEPAPLDYGVKFESRLRAEAEGGKITANDGELVIEGVNRLLIRLVANTSFYTEKFEEKNQQSLNQLEGMNYEELWERHVVDYRKYYSRVNFELGGKGLDNLPTDKRLERIKEGAEDLDLISDLFQYGRYLLISSSRPGTNPANLQGIWNEHIQAPWNADYHLNINLQMNYWPAELTNLSELHEPLFDYGDRLIKRGRITANQQYGINRGSVIHHASDIWAAPFMRAAHSYWGSWIHGGGWLAQHYWEHYRYTEDKDFLENRAYPALKAFAEFYLDWLVFDEETGKWVSTPEISPENSYINENGENAAVSYGSAMGHQIINEVFDNTISAADILGIDDDFVEEVRQKRKNLYPGIVVGDDNRILEWNRPYEEPEKGHRHISHLYALHPGDDIISSNSEVFNAAQNSIDYRLEHGGAGTGWSRAWMINFNARLLDPSSARENVNKFMEISLAENLFDLHPPFQIDGNFGFTAGVAEMLMQSHEDFIRILPALPESWENGKIKGLKARGNVEVDIEWKNNELKGLVLKSNKTQFQKIYYAGKEVELNLSAGKEIMLHGELEPMQ